MRQIEAIQSRPRADSSDSDEATLDLATPGGPVRVRGYTSSISGRRSMSDAYRREHPKTTSISERYSLPNSYETEDCWTAYRCVIEVSRAVNETAKGVALCELKVGICNSNNEIVPVDGEGHELAKKVMKSLRGPDGLHYKHLLHTAAMNIQVTGDAYLVAQAHDRDLGGRINGYHSWEVLSTNEIEVKREGGEMVIYRDNVGAAPGLMVFNDQTNSKIKLDTKNGNHWVARIYRPHPEHSALSDSAVKNNLVVIEEIIRLTELVHAVINSRKASGILLLPEEISFGQTDQMWDDDGHIDEETADDLDPVDRELYWHYLTGIEDHASPEAVAPLILRGAGEYLKFAQYIDTSKNLDVATSRLRKDQIERLIMGLDIPREILEGKSGVNHWTGYNIGDDFATKHVYPLGELISQRLTIAFLRPELIRAGMDPEQAANYHIIFDNTALISRPDRGSVAKSLFECGVLSEQSLLEANGFTMKDAPNQQERIQALLLDLIKTSPVTIAPDAIEYLDGMEELGALIRERRDARELGVASGGNANRRSSELPGDDTRGRRLQVPRNARSNDPTRDRRADQAPTQARREETSRGGGSNLNPALAPLAENLIELCERARTQAVSTAAVRFIPYVREALEADDNWEFVHEVNGLEPEQWLFHLGRDGLTSLGLEESDLLENSFDRISEAALVAIGEFLHDELGESNSGDIAPLLTANLIIDLRDYVTATLCTEPVVGPDRYLPDGVVLRALSAY